MDARRQTSWTLPSRQAMTAGARGHGPFAQASVSSRAEIFKKSPCAAGLKPVGRHVAKDMKECVGLQLPNTNVLILGTRIEVGSALFSAGAAFDRKLTSALPASRKSKAAIRTTNTRCGAVWMKSRLVEPGLGREMQCDADV